MATTPDSDSQRAAVVQALGGETAEQKKIREDQEANRLLEAAVLIASF